MIRRCKESDFNTIFMIINDAAQAYKGVIPEDRWNEPYMPFEELMNEIEDGVVFWGLEFKTKTTLRSSAMPTSRRKLKKWGSGQSCSSIWRA